MQGGGGARRARTGWSAREAWAGGKKEGGGRGSVDLCGRFSCVSEQMLRQRRFCPAASRGKEDVSPKLALFTSFFGL